MIKPKVKGRVGQSGPTLVCTGCRKLPGASLLRAPSTYTTTSNVMQDTMLSIGQNAGLALRGLLTRLRMLQIGNVAVGIQWDIFYSVDVRSFPWLFPQRSSHEEAYQLELIAGQTGYQEGHAIAK